MCTAAPPPGASSNPNARGPASLGSAGSYVSPTPETTPSGTQIPVGANAGLAASRAREGENFGTQSFQEQGHSGVGTPLTVPYGAPPPPPVVTPTDAVTDPRLMDTGPLFGSQVTPTTPAMAPLDPTPTVNPSPSFDLFQPTTAGSMLPPAQVASSPTYAAQPQGSANVVNALMRRRVNQGGYY